MYVVFASLLNVFFLLFYSMCSICFHCFLTFEHFQINSSGNIYRSHEFFFYVSCVWLTVLVMILVSYTHGTDSNISTVWHKYYK